MSLPIFIINTQAINSQAMTGNITSSVIDISEVRGYAVHFIWTGTPTGDVVVEGSNDGSNFSQISTAATGGAAGQSLSNQADANYKYVRVKYTFTSGTGTLNAYVSGKQ